MTTTLAAPRSASQPTPFDRGRGPLTGFGTLLRFMLRRDRIRFPAWTLGLVLLVAYFANALQLVFPTAADLGAFAAFSSNPAAALLMGPGFGGDEPSLDRFLASTYGMYLIIGACLMSILTVVRHTRLEEQSGRAELVRANVVGRHAQLSAALGVTVLMNLTVAVLMGALLTAMEFDPAGSFAFGASVGAAGVAFAGIAATSAQLTAFPRTASGIAGAVLGGGFVVRGLGDMSAAQGGDLGWLAWLTPIGWSQQVAPFDENRWGPMAVSVGCFILFAALAYALSTRRDLGAGLVQARRGSAGAAPWLSSPFALALRLQRASLIGWTASLLAGAFVYGAFTQAMLEGFADAPPELLVLFGGEDDLLTGYVGMMGLLFALVVTIYAILSVQSLRSEEAEGRSEAVLATAVGRPDWMGSWIASSALGVLLLLVTAGVGTGAGAALTTGEGDLFGEALLGHVAHAPAVWATLAVAALLYGGAPRLVPLAWAVFGYAFVVGFFGPLLDAPDWVVSLSPFEHIGEYPADELSSAAMLTLTGIAIVLTGAGLALFRRRDLTAA
ncbi:ABC transporter permease [Agromyces humatus]|uniref:Exporter of polyketide antibiotics n=1 Tax=Agromyces humatus TaxID=279573 RepID=A0ABP4X8E8_9MICO|nr:ABC transporter permease [Agromyces humatus]